MLHVLSQLQLNALLQYNTIWLAVDNDMAWMLDICCIGSLEGGPATAAQVAAVAGCNAVPQDVLCSAHDMMKANAQQRLRSKQQLRKPRILQQPRQLQPQQQQQQQQQCQQQSQSQQPDVAHSGAGAGCSTAAAFGQPHSDDEVMKDIEQGTADDAFVADSQQGIVNGGTADSELGAADTDVQAPLPNGHHQQPETHPEKAAQASTSALATQTGTLSASENHAPILKGVHSGHPCHTGMSVILSGSKRKASEDMCQAPAVLGLSRTHQLLKAVRLSPEEAFFLQHVLSCLVVMSADCGQQQNKQQEQQQQSDMHVDGMLSSTQAAGAVQELSSIDLWLQCCAIHGSFPSSYAAYHHLRSKGWIPRPGIMYGVDCVLYQLHPSVVHSDFLVLVVPQHHQQCADNSTHTAGEQPQPAAPQDHPHQQQQQQQQIDLAWLDVQVAQRLARQVFKRLLLLYVMLPPAQQLHAPLCMQQTAVQEVIVRRWVPNGSAEGQND
eukprot:jgi/Chrzof1/7461/Cz02g24250.t1